ncbi:MAG: preprotein translocase subunit SecG [Lachnospiraceae bacterium]|uniref:Protein-export membrane protein SecG n=1 Tax=Candidatus Weimeria bifida TaxID=2599074 RepID=A0A6N7IWE7_9FIRM|nr:preprotein translocase subunit SecG [Candidatus Weimeria bifida]RRF96014.1 MAG: preprotein translocase subunit SecG [Lachnospiraceae bacterium]
MTVLKYLFMTLFIIVSIVLTIVVMMQESADEGLGSLSGQSLNNTYWGKNKGRSREGVIVRVTAILVAVFFVLAAVLNMNSFSL